MVENLYLMHIVKRRGRDTPTYGYLNKKVFSLYA